MKILLTTIALLLANVVHGQYAWVAKASMNTGRYAGTGFTIGTKAYVGTGYNTANVTQSDLWEWDQTTNVWTQKANINNARFGAASFTLNGFGYVGLGLSSGGFFTDLQRYDPIANTWAPMASLPASGRYGSSSFAINNKGYIACGNMGSAAGSYSTQLWEYDPISNAWTLKAPFPGLSRYGGRGASLNNLGYVFGGLNGTGTSASSFFADLWQYDPSVNSWLQMNDIPGLGRSYASTFILDNKFVAGSGIHWTGTLSDFYAFDETTNNWSTLPSLPATPRWGGVGFDLGGNGYIATGILPNNSTVGELWELSVLTDAHEIESINDEKLYPNPATTFIRYNCNFTSYKNLKIVISNLSGQIIKTLDIEGGSKTYEFELVDFASGIYNYQIVNDETIVIVSKLAILK